MQRKKLPGICQNTNMLTMRHEAIGRFKLMTICRTFTATFEQAPTHQAPTPQAPTPQAPTPQESTPQESTQGYCIGSIL